MPKALKSIAAISALVCAANLVWSHYNPAVAEQEVPCGTPCDSYRECGGSCYICFPNPMSDKAGSCTKQ